MKRYLPLLLSIACSVGVSSPPSNDADLDGVLDAVDNCPSIANAQQTDEDQDGVGNPCDACPLDRDNDADGDGLCFALDNCPDHANPDQADADWDGWGDACDACPDDAEGDSDNDSVCLAEDNCPEDANPLQEDFDEDGQGDACDACPASANGDSDGDGLCDDADNCPERFNPEQRDRDQNDQGDACQLSPDSDGDGVADAFDNCPEITNPGMRASSQDFSPYAHPENQLELGDDARSDSLDLGFDFPFFSAWRQQLRVHANGFVSFDLRGRNQRFDRAKELPSDEAPRLAIFGFWTDLDPSEGGDLRYGGGGEAPNRYFVVEWDQIPAYGASDDDDPVFFQIVVHERGAVEIICLTCETRGSRNATQGIQNYARSVAVGFPGRSAQALALSDDSLLFETAAQPDLDDNGVGDLCDDDRDGDGIANDADICPDVADPEQNDRDGNGLGDLCNDSEDSDGDDWADELDNCPRSANPEQDEICSYIRLSGSLRYSDRLYNSEGMTGVFEERPVAFAQIELLGAEDGRVLDMTSADADGNFALEAEWLNQEQWQIRALSQSAGDTPVRVINRAGNPELYALSNAPFTPAPGDEIDLIASHESSVGAAFNIFATSVEAYRFVRRFSPFEAPPLTLQWAPLEEWGCGSCYSRNRIRLGGQESDPDEWDDDVIRHEFAHYFIDRFSNDDSPGGSHNGDRTNPLLAYGEGVATFFGSMVSNQPWYIDIRGERVTRRNLETIGDNEQYRGTGSNRLDGGVSEYLVGPILWDLYDDSGDSEAHDSIALGAEEMMTVLLETLGDGRADIGVAGVDLADFINQVECRNDAQRPAVAALCTERNFPWVSDEHIECSKARQGLALRLLPLDGELQIALEQQSLMQTSQWTLAIGEEQRSLTCKAFPCATGLVPSAGLRLRAWRHDGPEEVSFAGPAAIAKALGGSPAPASARGHAVRNYR